MIYTVACMPHSLAKQQQHSNIPIALSHLFHFVLRYLRHLLNLLDGGRAKQPDPKKTDDLQCDSVSDVVERPLHLGEASPAQPPSPGFAEAGGPGVSTPDAVPREPHIHRDISADYAASSELLQLQQHANIEALNESGASANGSGQGKRADAAAVGENWQDQWDQDTSISTDAQAPTAPYVPPTRQEPVPLWRAASVDSHSSSSSVQQNPFGSPGQQLPYLPPERPPGTPMLSYVQKDSLCVLQFLGIAFRTS